jgi:hypothetical protein
MKEWAHKKYNWPLFVKTISRIYELYTATEEEREMWFAGFTYVLKSTREV